MKKTIYTLFVMLLVGGLVSLAQIKPIKRQNSTKQKTEKVSSKSNSSSAIKTSKSNKPIKTQTESRQRSLNRSSAMTQIQKDHIINQAIDDMVYVSGGTFTMGATWGQASAEKDEKPIHQVTLSDYYIGKFEITQALWIAVMGNNPSVNTGDLNLPVENVSWVDCQEFIQNLNQMTGKQFRLPTEAEWEYAARGGNRSNGYVYAGSDVFSTVAWCNEYFDKTHIVGKKAPNELGLYDMSGNVWEWVQDWYGSYQSYSQTNPMGASSGQYRVGRGGCYCLKPDQSRVSNRGGFSPSDKERYLGFRVAI